MRFQHYRITVDFMDGERVELHPAGGSIAAYAVADGVLNVRYKSGEFGDFKDLGSYPLTNIRKWQVSES